ncbi:MAG: carboxymuconolactone decarboxylase family protein [Myxococcales bacterium]|nr:carboxymuconolactone decarboxylase family protein [Myxococcales bacterium]
MPNRLRPLEPPFPADVQEVLASYPQVDGQLLALFRTFANSLRFLKKGVPNLLDRGSPLPLQHRELVILRTTARNDCEYEWGVHAAVFPQAAKLGEGQVRATRSAGPDAACWDEEQALLIRGVDELCAEGTLSDATLAGFQERWTVEQQLEILALCGSYHTISFVANVARLPGEPLAATFPAEASVGRG